MLAFDEETVTVASAFGLGFAIGVFVAIRLLGLTFNASQRVFDKLQRRIVRERIDRSAPNEVDTDSEGNPP